MSLNLFLSLNHWLPEEAVGGENHGVVIYSTIPCASAKLRIMSTQYVSVIHMILQKNMHYHKLIIY